MFVNEYNQRIFTFITNCAILRRKVNEKVAKLKNRLPEIVKEWLDAQDPKVSITELAQRAKLNPSTLSYMLRSDPRRIDLNTVESLHDVIGFDLAEVIVEVED